MTLNRPVIKIKSPFPFFGGKSRAAEMIWERFGDVENYIEPFAGSLAVLLQRPHSPGYETVNDRDAMISNFWRASQYAPDEVAAYADGPANETDLEARHTWLCQQYAFRDRIAQDPHYYDAKIAGWWVWGISLWHGAGWCERPDWRRYSVFSHARGIHAMRRRAAAEPAPFEAPPHEGLQRYFARLRDRLALVRVCHGDWTRLLAPSPTTTLGMTAVLLDPPYAGDRYKVYTEDSMFLAHEVAEWAIRFGDDPALRIALCGYEGTVKMPKTWECAKWKAGGGFSNRAYDDPGRNAAKERIWFSPTCLKAAVAERAAERSDCDGRRTKESQPAA